MESREQALTDRYLGLLARTGQDFAWPAIPFSPGHEGDAHVAFNADGSWSTIVTDRGQEYGERRYDDMHELMFGLCARATWAAALREVDAAGIGARALEERAQALQVELMGRIDPAWSRRLRRSYAEWSRTRARMDAADAVADRLNLRGRVAVWLICAATLGLAAAVLWGFG